MARNRKKKQSIPDDQFEALQLELSVLQRRLQSKDQALQILRQELICCQEEKEEQCRLLQHMKDCFFGRESLSSALGETEEEILGIPVTVEQLQKELKAQHDKHIKEMKLLKERMLQTRSSLSPPSKELEGERERLVSQLEAAQAEIISLERQVQSLEDDREELESERDYFAGKCVSLENDREESNRARPPPQDLLQHTIDENRKQKLELIEVQAERDRALNKIERYKRAVERRKARERQNRTLQFITADKLSGLRDSVKRASELEALSNSLSEEVNAKSVALIHQKKTNKMLASRIADLEHRLKVLQVSGLWSTDDHQSDHSTTPQAHSDIQKAPAAISVQAECHSAVDDGDDDLSCDDDHELNIDQVFTNTAAAV